SGVGGADWFDTRPYGAGDELRAIDWRVYGRSDRLVVRRREEATRRSVAVVLDGSASMSVGGSAKWGAALRAALGAAWMAGQDGGVVRVGVLRGGEARWFAVSGLESMAAGLVGVKPEGEAGVAAWFDEAPERTAEVVLVSDLREVRDTVLKALGSSDRGEGVAVVRVLGADEVEGPRVSEPSGWVELVEAETDRRRRVRGGAFEAAYRRAVAADRSAWRRDLVRCGVGYSEVVAAGVAGEVVRGLLGLRS
ncbi:MAG: DUF58 domain-containing protein, partial [Planctomycetota bacterium]